MDILEGVKSFYTDKMEPVSPDNSAEAHLLRPHIRQKRRPGRSKGGGLGARAC